jgi:drug/metabolite transporter (DMT)-like permease
MFPYLLAIGANLFFGTASIPFARLSREQSPLWMNQIKVTVALICFGISFLVAEHFVHQTTAGYFYLLFSGFIGLCIGDMFLFRAFATLGAARTLVLYSFQPFLLGIYGFAFLGQSLNAYQIIAIFCMITCVFTFVFERNKTTGQWDLMNFLAAFVGILFDAVGIMFSRQAYEVTPGLGSFQANGTRALGALLGFMLINPRGFISVYRVLMRMTRRDQATALGASFMGTFVSLSLYLQALKTAHVATLTAVSITGPVWVSFIEHAKTRTWPNRYLWCAFLFFILGFVTMMVGTYAH